MQVLGVQIIHLMITIIPSNTFGHHMQHTWLFPTYFPYGSALAMFVMFTEGLCDIESPL